MFMGEGGGGVHEDATSFVYSSKLLLRVIITIKLLCFHFDEKTLMERWKNTRKIAILVILDLESELCLSKVLSW